MRPQLLTTGTPYGFLRHNAQNGAGGSTNTTGPVPHTAPPPSASQSTHPAHPLLRPHGRNEVAYGMPAKSAAERFDYAYTSAELQTLAQRYSPIARSVRYPHAVFNNCMEDKSQLNAREFLEALKAS